MIQIAMCPPKYMSARIPNNKWMKDIPEKDREVNREVAMKQFFDIYTVLSSVSIVWLIPPKPRLQDQVYVSNAGVVLAHDPKVAILSNFTAEGRAGEEDAAYALLNELGYECYFSPYKFEGEADFKWLHDNVYVGHYGIRTEEKFLDWISEEFNCKVIKVKGTDPYLYHLDCSIFPLSEDYCMVYEGIPKSSIEAIKKEVEIIPVTKEEAYAGITNSVRIGYEVFNGKSVSETLVGTESYKWEIAKQKKLEEVCSRFGLGLTYFDMGEFLKSGALLSCMVLHLSYDRIKLQG